MNFELRENRESWDKKEGEKAKDLKQTAKILYNNFEIPDVQQIQEWQKNMEGQYKVKLKESQNSRFYILLDTYEKLNPLNWKDFDCKKLNQDYRSLSRVCDIELLKVGGLHTTSGVAQTFNEIGKYPALSTPIEQMLAMIINHAEDESMRAIAQELLAKANMKSIFFAIKKHHEDSIKAYNIPYSDIVSFMGEELQYAISKYKYFEGAGSLLAYLYSYIDRKFLTYVYDRKMMGMTPSRYSGAKKHKIQVLQEENPLILNPSIFGQSEGSDDESTEIYLEKIEARYIQEYEKNGYNKKASDLYAILVNPASENDIQQDPPYEYRELGINLRTIKDKFAHESENIESFWDILGVNPEREKEEEKDALKEDIQRIIEKMHLSESSLKIINDYYAFGKEWGGKLIDEIADEHLMTRERIRQIIQELHKKIKSYMEKKKSKSFEDAILYDYFRLEKPVNQDKIQEDYPFIAQKIQKYKKLKGQTQTLQTSIESKILKYRSSVIELSAILGHIDKKTSDFARKFITVARNNKNIPRQALDVIEQATKVINKYDENQEWKKVKSLIKEYKSLDQKSLRWRSEKMFVMNKDFLYREEAIEECIKVEKAFDSIFGDENGEYVVGLVKTTIEKHYGSLLSQKK